MSVGVVPDGLVNLLEEFTISVLTARPDDLLDFAVDYFVGRRDSRDNEEGTRLYDKTSMSLRYSGNFTEGRHLAPDEGPTFSVAPPFVSMKAIRLSRIDKYPETHDDENDDKTELAIFPKSDSERENLGKILAGILIFRCLNKHQISKVMDSLTNVLVHQGDVIIRQNDEGDNFYIIQSGIYDIKVTSNVNDKLDHVTRMYGRGFFGELALMYSQPRTATVVAVGPGELWAMDRKSFTQIVLKNALHKRRSYQDFLETIPLLHALTDYQRLLLADALSSHPCVDGGTIIRKSEDGNGMYFVEEGQVRVTIMNPDASEKTVSIIGKGGYFGEMAVIQNARRSANVYAVGPTRLSFLDRESFFRVLSPCMDKLLKSLEKYI